MSDKAVAAIASLVPIAVRPASPRGLGPGAYRLRTGCVAAHGAAIAALLGVAQNTVSGWLTPNIESDNRRKTDSRIKLVAEDKDEIQEQLGAGEPQEQV